ncbi:3-hydroxyisobutyryl-CoA hydrolase [Corynebacterium pacaense]|uniref:3-hydroxyisobutyryl-CoA hydrolase n=1 Tax=Corynebacterium pacaense TaxID=1816684 RepID=UPI0009B93C1A|nr:3-hydroxyisobutyryl-CoA hydrolase [Corynebacterium pacaense]
MVLKADNSEKTVNASVHNSTGIIELNRPRALNSLNQEMIELIHGALAAFRDEDSVEQVLICSTSEKAFCAGGDVRAVREAVLEGNLAAGDRYFVEEFNVNDELGNFPKPVISVIDGVVMGGGLGVSMHGSHRVITEKAFASMPEMAIGYVPDVGFTYFSQRVTTPAIATFLGVTGWRMSPADMLWAGVATEFIHSRDVGAFIETLIDDSLATALATYATSPAEPSRLASYAEQINSTFGAGSWKLIDAALDAYGDREFVAEVRGLMKNAAPESVVAATILFAANRDADSLRAALNNELAVSLHLIRRPDFLEGVRAVLVDKDRNAVFHPATFGEVDEQTYRNLLSL